MPSSEVPPLLTAQEGHPVSAVAVPAPRTRSRADLGRRPGGRSPPDGGPAVHLSVPTSSTPRLPALHVPALRLDRGPTLPAALLSLLYVAAIVVALTAPGQHAVAGSVVLLGLTARSVARRRRRPAAAVPLRAPAPAPATAA